MKKNLAVKTFKPDITEFKELQNPIARISNPCPQNKQNSTPTPPQLQFFTTTLTNLSCQVINNSVYLIVLMMLFSKFLKMYF